MRRMHPLVQTVLVGAKRVGGRDRIMRSYDAQFGDSGSLPRASLTRISHFLIYFGLQKCGLLSQRAPLDPLEARSPNHSAPRSPKRVRGAN
jgi:hypothetical protein